MRRIGLVLAAASLAAIAALYAAAQAPAPILGAELVSAAFRNPLYVTAPPGDSRLFVVEQPGRIRIVADGTLVETPFLDVTGPVGSGGERGLLGLAFHPDYAENGRFFINYTDEAGDTNVVEYRVSADPNLADPASARPLFEVDQPAGNHNGGWLGFGPDGLLYIAMGDGGGGNDTFGNSQNTATLLAKILRIDVDSGAPYAIPESNPFPNAPEAWVTGVRNPWRLAFDGTDLYIADVGQNAIEEVSVISTADAGANLGWNIMEGTACFRPPTGCNQTGLVLPVYEYSHAAGCSISGGFVYRGTAIPELVGNYIFGDYCSGFVRSFRLVAGAATELTDWSSQIGDVGQITSFGQDSAGELYITAADGRVFKIVPR